MDETNEYALNAAYFYIEDADGLSGAFREVTGLGSESEVIENKVVNGKGREILQKLPGRMKVNNVVFKRGMTSGDDGMCFWEWRKKVEEGNVAGARQNFSVVLVGQNGETQARWNLYGAWPSKLTGPAPKSDSNEVAIEELEVVAEGYERVRI